MRLVPCLILGTCALAASEHLRGDLLHLSPAWQVVAIVAGTLISEDLTAIAIGALIREHKIDPLLGTLSCFLGIWIGDLGYWLLGRLVGRPILQFRALSRRLPMAKLEAFGAWFDRRAWAAVGACRFLPGIRVPLYVSIGALSRRTAAFIFWTFAAAAVWTPVLVFLTVLLGDVFARAFERVIGAGWAPIVLACGAVFLIVKVGMALVTPDGRAALAARLRGKRPAAREPVGSAASTSDREPV